MFNSYKNLFNPQQAGLIAVTAEGNGKGACNGDSGGPLFCTM